MDDQRFRQVFAKAVAGDAAAADSLFVAAYEVLHAAVARQMDPILLARLQAEDVIQEVYAAAWPKLEDGCFDTFAAFTGWLKTIAKNKLIDLRRGYLAAKHDVKREIARPRAADSSYTTFLDRVASSSPTPSRGAARSEAMALLVTQLSRLPDDYRCVLQLRYVRGLSVPEIADRLNDTEGAVHMRCARALRKLGEQMGSASNYLTKG